MAPRHWWLMVGNWAATRHFGGSYIVNHANWRSKLGSRSSTKMLYRECCCMMQYRTPMNETVVFAHDKGFLIPDLSRDVQASTDSFEGGLAL